MKPSEDGCNQCECTDDSMWSCTEGPCPVDTLELCSGDEPDDLMWVTDAKITGDILVVDLLASGGCAEHIYGGCWEGSFAESDPVQTGVSLSHDSMGDPCEAEVEGHLKLDLTAIKQSWQDSYQQQSGTIILHVDGWEQGLEYTF